MAAISPELALANQVQLLIGAATSMSRTWIPTLIDKKLDQHGELRNKVFNIYISGLMDACEGSEMRLIEIGRTATRLNQPAATFYLKTVKCYIEAITDVLGLYSAKEMAFIGENRNQMAHGRWSEYSKDHRVVRYIEGGSLKRIKVPSDQYWADQRSMHMGSGKSYDDAIADLRHRLYSHPTLFWIVDGALRQDAIQSNIYEDLRLGSNWSSPKVNFRFENDSYWETIKSPKAPLRTLYEIRQMRTITSLYVRDPIIPKLWPDMLQQFRFDIDRARGSGVFAKG